MPAFVAGFTAFFTGATVVGVTGVLGFLAATAVFNAALGAIARKLTSKKGFEETGQRFQRDVTVRATDAYEVFVYGRALVGGITVYHNGIQDSDGVTNRMHHVVKWVGHECTSIELFRLDDRVLDPGSDSIDWDPTSYDGSGLVGAGEFRGDTAANGPTFMRWYLGNQTAADGRLRNQAVEWTSNHKGQGQCYGDLEIRQVDRKEQTSKVYQKGFPANIGALIHGKKVYDHRRYALNREPKFQSINSHWFGANDATVVSGDLSASSDNWTTVQGTGGKHDRGIANSSAVLRRTYSDLIPVDPSSVYSLRVDARDINASSRALRANVLGFMDTGVGISAQAWVNTTLTEDWAEFIGTVASGGTVTLSDSARFIRIGLEVSSGTGGTMHLQAQDYAVYLGSGSRQLVDVSSTWQYSESPPFCVADYLTDERLGFGKHLRIPVNPSRYARNGDPTWRRENTLTNGVWWRTSPVSGAAGAISSIGSVSLSQTGAPVGRRALVVAGSDGTQAGGHQFFSDAVPIDPSGFYTISVQARQDGAKAAYLAVAFLDGNGNNITAATSGDATGWPSEGTFHYFHANAPLSDTWSNHLISIGSGATASIPSCASFLAVGALCVRSAGANGDTQQYFQEYQVHVGTQIRHFIEPHEQIFWPSVSSAASYTDAIVATPSGDQVRFSCNGAGHTGAGHRSNVRDLLSSFNGRCVYVQSGFHISAGWEEPTKTLNKSDFRKGGMKIRAKAEMLDRYNHVRGAFYDPDNEFKRVPTATVTAAEYMARDSSQQLFHDVFLPFTNDWFMAQRVEFGILEQGDNQQLVEFQLKHSALDLMPGKVVGINHDVVSWTNHTLRMVDMETDLKQGVKLFGREDYEASYVDPSTSEYFSREFNGVTSSAPIVPQVSSVSLTPRDGGIQLKWQNPAARSFEWIDVYRQTTNAFSGSTLIKSTRNDEYFDTLQAGQTQFYWFQTRDFANNVSSVFPGLVSSFSAAGLFPVARDPEYVFFEEFRYPSLAEFQQKWELVSGSGGISFPSNGVIGGSVLQASGDTAWWVSRIRIPYDPEALYQMTAMVRLTTSADAERNFYAGFTGFRGDGITPVATNSDNVLTSAHHFVRIDQAVDSSIWAEYIGHVRGYMPWPTSGTVYSNVSQDPKLSARMHDDVRYVSPHFILNWEGGAGTMQFGPIKVRKLIPYRTMVLDTDVTLESNWLGGYAYNDQTSFDFFDAYLANSLTGFSKVELDGKFSLAHLNVQSQQLGNAFYVLHERLRTEFHTKFAEASSISFNWQATVYVSSNGGTAATILPAAFVVTGQGSLAARGQAAGGFIAAEGEWRTGRGTITLGNSSINTNSYPGPYYVVPGFSARITGAPTSYALATLYMDRIG